jgi:hypothetical protein
MKKHKRKKQNKHRETQLLALALKLGCFNDYPLRTIKELAARLNIVLSDEEVIKAENYLKENCL